MPRSRKNSSAGKLDAFRFRPEKLSFHELAVKWDLAPYDEAYDDLRLFCKRVYFHRPMLWGQKIEIRVRKKGEFKQEVLDADRAPDFVIEKETQFAEVERYFKLMFTLFRSGEFPEIDRKTNDDLS